MLACSSRFIVGTGSVPEIVVGVFLSLFGGFNDVIVEVRYFLECIDFKKRK